MPLIFGAEGRRSNAFGSRGELPPHSAISGTGRRLAVLAVRAGTGLKLIRARLAPRGRARLVPRGRARLAPLGRARLAPLGRARHLGEMPLGAA
jgi:hypothetical protein